MNTQIDSAIDIVPTRGKLVIRQAAAASASPAGIIIPENKKPNRGTVVAIGDPELDANGYEIDQTIVENDMVIYNGYAGIEIEVDHEKYVVLQEKDVLVVLREK